MTTLENKIDFAVILQVEKANPNGDPLNGNRPRIDYNGIGEISDVCLKRKIRNRLLDAGYPILVQSDDYKVDEATSIKKRIDSKISSETQKDKKKFYEAACKEWFDIRAFGQVLAFKSDKKSGKKSENDEEQDDTGISIAIRGPVSIHSAFSIEAVIPESLQITKSVNNEDSEKGKKSSDTMGMKHRIDKAIYVFYGSMNPQLAEKTGFSNEDAEAIKKVLPKLFENDESSARPAGSMSVLNVIWWNHGSKSGKYSSAKVHHSLKVKPDGTFELKKLEGLEPEIIDGF
ncbi:MAG TPA: type I-C CRISPR-associated protein Cas7/Csd2 [Bacteroidales bacterium]|nr:type I-C CRISPR-associated protein Cas7/Csd2 [Bacteroidales bacterium]HOK99162.1 type I-C CRISPR-associated protein Cas7/Csd2 [Bacteroidales bacterium]